MDKEKIVKLINTYWRFDNDQDHISTWHDKQDLISAIEQLTITVVGLRSEQLKRNKTCFMCGVKKDNDGHTCCEDCGGVSF